MATVHEKPQAGLSHVPCCGRSTYSLPRDDKLSANAAKVTCKGRDK